MNIKRIILYAVAILLAVWVANRVGPKIGF